MKVHLLATITLFAISSSVTAENEAKAKPLYAKVAPACLEILVGGRLDGSATIVSKEGLVLTACHVIRKKSKRYEALSPTLGRHPLELVCTDRSHDLALLSLPKRENSYPFLPIAKNIPNEGKPCYLFGAPVFRHNLLITGYVAKKKSSFEWYDGAFAETFAIAGIGAGGTSGGPWLNARGEIVGVQVASMTLGDVHQGIASAIPPSAIRSLMEKRETIVTPTMQAAVEEIWGQSPEFLEKIKPNTKGLLLRQVAKGGVAAKAGLKNEE
ncbi:MAG: trypsin-like peptidase domain-containing protein, partial [Opitutae bacterium]|nr:trypsin-like peptidase domain-containing protein [Opitutae bacterium]